MARLERIEYPGAFYHVTNRGNRRQAIFLSDDDKLLFMNCLRDAYQRHAMISHAYCLMDNHYHLFVETPRGNLSRAMHLVNLKYATYFNLKHSLEGHTFQSPYGAILVQAEAYAREVAPYIHLNPVRAGVVERPESYRWSNYRMYLGLAPEEPWSTGSFVLGLFGASLPEARAAYEREVRTRVMLPAPDLFGSAERTGILGTPEFIAGITRPDERAGSLGTCGSRVELTTFRPTLAQIAAEAEALCGGSDRLGRKISIYIAHKDTDLPLSVIGEFFALGESGIADVCRRLRKEAAHNETLARIIAEVELRLRQQGREERRQRG